MRLASNMASSTQLPLSEQAQRLLYEINRESTDGYTLMSRLGVKNDSDFLTLVKQLVERSLVSFRGELSQRRIGEAYFFVPLESQGKANSLLWNMR